VSYQDEVVEQHRQLLLAVLDALGIRYDEAVTKHPEVGKVRVLTRLGELLAAEEDLIQAQNFIKRANEVMGGGS